MLITVNATITRISDENPIRIIDLYGGAPEPGTLTDGLRTTTSNLLWLLDGAPEAQWNDPQGHLVEARASRMINEQNRPEPGAYEAAFPFKMTPLDFQMKIFAAARHMTEIALAPCAMGTGKTKMTLDIAADKFMRDEIDTLVVIAPNGVHKQWINTALPAHMSPRVRYVGAVWSPTRKTPKRVADRPTYTPKPLRILAFNVESFSSESGKAYKAAREFCQTGRAMIVIDESSRIKNTSTIRTKTIQKLRQYSVVRMNLSGTPVTKGLEDLYSQYAFLNPAIIGMSSYYGFRNRYCNVVPAYRGASFGAVKIISYRNVEEFVRKIAPYTFVVPKDVLGLPEKTYERREVPMTAEQKKLYTALKDELVEDLRAQNIKTPANAAVRLVRLQQILCGHAIEVEEGTNENGDDITVTTTRSVPSHRLEVLLDVLGEHDGPAVIWCRYTDDILDVKSLLEEEGHAVVSYYGETGNADREEAVKAFKEGRARYFIGNPAAAGTGLDGLQIAQLAVYYSNGFAAENRWQSEDRIHRIGMAGRAHYIDLVCPGTVDKLILDNLTTKGSLARAVFVNPSLLEAEDNGIREVEQDFVMPQEWR